MTLELEDIQGDIVRAYGNAYDCTTYVFVELSGVRAGRAWLKELAAQVSDAAKKWLDKKRSATGYLIKEAPSREEKRS